MEGGFHVKMTLENYLETWIQEKEKILNENFDIRDEEWFKELEVALTHEKKALKLLENHNENGK